MPTGTATQIIEPLLREQSFGEWHGLDFADLWERIRDLPPHNWSYLAPESAPPGGESYLALWERVAEFRERLSGDPDPGPRVLVTHAGVIRAFVGQALGLSASRALALGVEPLSVTLLTQQVGEGAAREDRGGAWKLIALNRT